MSLVTKFTKEEKAEMMHQYGDWDLDENKKWASEQIEG